LSKEIGEDSTGCLYQTQQSQKQSTSLNAKELDLRRRDTFIIRKQTSRSGKTEFFKSMQEIARIAKYSICLGSSLQVIHNGR